MAKLFALLVIILFPLLLTKPVYADLFLQQTQNYSTSLNVWQTIQEFGDNLDGELKTFTFRISTSIIPRNSQFDYTAQNTRIYDKTLNQVVASGCASGPGSDQQRGLTFNQVGVPSGYEDVTIDFSCMNFSFLPGHRYLIRITNANRGGKYILELQVMVRQARIILQVEDLDMLLIMGLATL